MSWHSGLRAGSSISVLRRNQLTGTGSCFRDLDGGVASSSCLTLSAGVALVVQFGFPLAPGDDRSGSKDNKIPERERERETKTELRRQGLLKLR